MQLGRRRLQGGARASPAHSVDEFEARKCTQCRQVEISAQKAKKGKKRPENAQKTYKMG
jgi:hypothetical protein